MLRTLAGTFALATLLGGTAASRDAVWSADGMRSNAKLTVSNLLLGRVSGIIPIVSGTIVTAAGSDVPERVDVILDAGALTTHDAARDADLRSPRFFDVTRFPVIRFTSDRVDQSAPGVFAIRGQLAMRGRTQPIVFETHCVPLARDPDGRSRLRYESFGSFRRSDFGMTAAPIVVGNRVALHVVIEALR